MPTRSEPPLAEPPQPESSGEEEAPKETRASRVLGRWSGAARLVLGALALVAILFLFVFPAQSLLGRRAEVNDVKRDVQVLRDENAKLSEEAARLRTVSEVERLAREQYHMVYPGEKPYAVLPTPPTTAATPPTSTTTTTVAP